MQLLRYAAAVLAAGLPLVAFLQLVRVYGQAMSQIADAEVRLFHLYVHEPLMRDGVPGCEMAEEMEGLAREILPLASPIMEHAHTRFLQHFIEQDVIGHMEADLERRAAGLLGRLRVAIAFADLAGYTRLTEEVGDEEAVSVVERFVESVERTLPEDARIIKTIGDEVMVVGSDAGALLDWAVRFQQEEADRPRPRIGIHYGETLYRDGDYYGREVNQASRVAARAAGGEVLATRPVVEHAPDGPGLRADRRGPAEGLRRGDRAVPGAAARAATRRAEAMSGGRPRARARHRADRGGRAAGGHAQRRAGTAICLLARRGARWARRCARCTSTTGCAAPTATPTASCCVALCAELGVGLEVRRVAREDGAVGNFHAWARDVRYRGGRGAGATACVAAGHTLTDQLETILYRLASSPGRRALLGMDAGARAGSSGRCWPRGLRARRPRPTAWARGLAWREDASNTDRAYARARVREDLLPALRAVDPRAEANVLRTARHPARGGGGARRGRRGGRWPAAGASCRAPSWPRCRPRWGGWCCGAWPRTPIAGPCARAAGRLGEVLALGEEGALDLGDGARAIVRGGVVSVGRTPARDRSTSVPGLMRDPQIGEILVQPDDLKRKVREIGEQISRRLRRARPAAGRAS